MYFGNNLMGVVESRAMMDAMRELDGAMVWWVKGKRVSDLKKLLKRKPKVVVEEQQCPSCKGEDLTEMGAALGRCAMCA
ncbi:hypothetical protein JD969_06155 [Planctomycetota bacterium]|nr:hypothetical protein JD969_06155 [Planctomycetota bacterium]